MLLFTVAFIIFSCEKTGTTAPQPATGTITFFARSDLGVGNIAITINNQTPGNLTHYNPAGVTCGAGDVNINLAVGIYSWSAKGATGTTAWGGTVTVVTGGCQNIEITPSSPAGGSSPGQSKQWIVTTFAGSTAKGYTNGQGATAKFYAPRGLVFDQVDNLYVTDVGNNVIRKITPGGLVSTYAGSGIMGTVDGSLATAQFTLNSGITIDGNSNLYVTNSNCIRKITPAGNVTTIAGAIAGTTGFTDAQSTAARFNGPFDITADADGDLYVLDTYNEAIRKINGSGYVSTLCQSSTLFNQPKGIVFNKAKGSLFVANSWNFTILKITVAGEISVFAGTPNSAGYIDAPATTAKFGYPVGIAADVSGNMYVTDQGTRYIRKIASDATVSTFASSGINGFSDGPATMARFNQPWGVAVDSKGDIYVADTENNCIRKISYQ